MTKSWKNELKNLITEVELLWKILELPEEFLASAKKASNLFPLRVPKAMVGRIEKGNQHDPILKQFLPWHLELNPQPTNFEQDPLQEISNNKIPGLLHKYQGRVLLILSGACAINCRYCFRRHFPYQEHTLNKEYLEKILTYLAQDESISEVILSGGDPLIVPDNVLAKLILPLNELKHIKTLRIHSRIPVILPERIDTEFLNVCAQSRLQKVMVLHTNHANELNQEIRDVLQQLGHNNFHLLNQAVLLRGINDDAKSLIDLSNRLFEYGVLPYYLHLLDRVNHTAHFEVSLSEAQELMWQISQQLPGYLVPRLAREIPNLGCKWVYGFDEKFL